MSPHPTLRVPVTGRSGRIEVDSAHAGSRGQGEAGANSIGCARLASIIRKRRILIPGMFDEELAFFIANQDSLLKEHQGKILTLRGHEVVGAHDTLSDAYFDALHRFEPGTFMLQPCEPGPDAYTVTVSTRDLFVPTT
jgi:hypothetical protein